MTDNFERHRERMHADFDRHFRSVKRAVYFGWAVSLGVLGVLVWAVIRLVSHFAS